MRLSPTESIAFDMFPRGCQVASLECPGECLGRFLIGQVGQGALNQRQQDLPCARRAEIPQRLSISRAMSNNEVRFGDAMTAAA